MKRSLVLLVMVGHLGLGYSPVNAGLSLDSVDGQIGDGKVAYGVPITFYILWDGTEYPGCTVTGSSNGYHVYSPTGASVNVNADTSNYGILINQYWNPAIDWSAAGYDGGTFAGVYEGSGGTSDTVSFGGFRLFGTGLPDTFYGIAHIIRVDPLAQSDVGGEICIDSSSFGCCPWLWSTTCGAIAPSWSGPHCYTIVNCCSGIRGDANLDGSLDVGDLTFLIDYLFQGGPDPLCHAEADVNASTGVAITDLTYLVDYLFRGGPAPSACPEE